MNWSTANRLKYGDRLEVQVEFALADCGSDGVLAPGAPCTFLEIVREPPNEFMEGAIPDRDYQLVVVRFDEGQTFENGDPIPEWATQRVCCQPKCLRIAREAMLQ